jgi:hypothetical protein
VPSGDRGSGASRRGNRRCLDTLGRLSDRNNTLARLPFDTTGAFATCKLLLDSTRYRGAIKRFRLLRPIAPWYALRARLHFRIYWVSRVML